MKRFFLVMQINMHKSSVLFSKMVSPYTCSIVQQNLGATICKRDGKYLGLPYLGKRCLIISKIVCGRKLMDGMKSSSQMQGKKF